MQLSELNNLTRKQKLLIKDIGLHAAVVLALVPVLFPIYWLVVSALQTPATITQIPPQLVPSTLSLHFVNTVFSEFNIGRFLFNSVFLSVVSTFLTLVVASFAAFSHRAYSYKMKENFSKMVLFVYMFPQILIIIPLYLLMANLGLINTWHGLIFVYLAFELPICIWILQSYFETIPKDLIEAAEIDGLARVKCLWHIYLPVALPGLAASGVMTFISVWNNFLLANTLLIDEDLMTLPVIIADFATRDGMMQGDVLAASLLVCIPAFFFALFAQKFLVGGLTGGSVKG